MRSVRQLQRVAKWVAIVSALLGLAVAVGVGHLPRAWLRVDVLAVLLLLLGLYGGRLTVLRAREIEEERWRVLEDPDLTSGEREYAHRNAEQERRGAAIAFLLAPTLLAVWLSYQMRVEDRITAGDLLPVVPMLAFLAGLWLFRRPADDEPPEL